MNDRPPRSVKNFLSVEIATMVALAHRPSERGTIQRACVRRVLLSWQHHLSVGPLPGHTDAVGVVRLDVAQVTPVRHAPVGILGGDSIEILHLEFWLVKLLEFWLETP